MAQVTALIDANNFYASCEQSLDPSLIGRPVVVPVSYTHLTLPTKA